MSTLTFFNKPAGLVGPEGKVGTFFVFQKSTVSAILNNLAITLHYKYAIAYLQWEFNKVELYLDMRSKSIRKYLSFSIWSAIM